MTPPAGWVPPTVRWHCRTCGRLVLLMAPGRRMLTDGAGEGASLRERCRPWLEWQHRPGMRVAEVTNAEGAWERLDVRCSCGAQARLSRDRAAQAWHDAALDETAVGPTL